MKKFIFLILVVALVYLNYSNPELSDHQSALINNLNVAGVIPEEVQNKIWQDMDFSNFIICSATKTTLDSKMITIGYLNKVKIINSEWIENTIKKYQN